MKRFTTPTWAGRAALLACGWALAACASLPGQVQRPGSVAREDVQGTALASLAARAAPDNGAHESSFRLLPAAASALDTRMALVRRATLTLDVQYYLIAHDRTGLQFLGALRDAAARGVRVRVLVDDLYAAGQDALLAGLAANPRVEVRLFNPLPVRRGGFGARLLFSMHEFSRINQRMHNKLFVADNVFAVTGGRNMADEYFGRGGPANFIDMDILCTGPVVRELSSVFDRYWNSEHAYPVQSLRVGADDGNAARYRFDVAVQEVVPRHAAAPDDSFDTWLAASPPVLADARVVADAPGQVDATGAPRDDSSVMLGYLDLLRAARSEVLLASPYFIPGEHALAVLKQAVLQRVRFTVMTNSLSTTDVPLVHFGYARYRNLLLRMGVALHELMPTPQREPGEAPSVRGSLARLHAKLAVVDRRWLFIGSLNADRRSALCNTEVGLIIDSPELSGQVADLIRNERLPNSYRLRLADGGARIEWVAGDAVHRSEPDAGAGRQLRLWLTSKFISEDLL